MTGVLQTGGHIAGVLATVCLAVLVAFGVFPDLVERRLKGALGLLPAKLRPKLETLVSAFVSGTGSTRRGSFVFMLVAYTFVEWMIIAGCFWCVFRSIPAAAGLTALDTLIIVGFVAFGSAVQLPGVGGGMQVACVLVLTELYQFPLAAATGTAVLLWLISFVSIVPIGLLLMAREGLEFRKLMKRGSMEAL
ncbi:MAG: hypothetical protein HYZ37_18485 [Candidatus Solibacter usitatus]|nr:hypothetical protein [Candidatus Solibacter usitatus]